MGRAAGRGVPMGGGGAPPGMCGGGGGGGVFVWCGGAMFETCISPGLTGPVRGVGGPTPQMMAPQVGSAAGERSMHMWYHISVWGGGKVKYIKHNMVACVLLWPGLVLPMLYGS